jgi:hypothetical protein
MILFWRPAWKNEDSDWTIVFHGVQGYQFRNDAFGSLGLSGWVLAKDAQHYAIHASKEKQPCAMPS